MFSYDEVKYLDHIYYNRRLAIEEKRESQTCQYLTVRWSAHNYQQLGV